ncbi:saccharopine dehydrogenase NADP-binding domain-containing protein [Actinoplanes sp. RD1]|uniref:saccharopine dehydrogenase NADP-binding domain-containing protein n=1 Tax=Actinoplanes sp. RD1 TaxID=3064538 RepID=UPI002740D6B6|nr:saccharopine dehydrogenase NADP-binding domain-containing protein [Actinoplanes sp. RD1]
MIFVLGATGRIGRAVAALLAAPDPAPGGRDLVLVGRDSERLGEVAAGLPGPARTLVAADHAAAAREIRQARPAVVVNTLGGYAETAATIARACLPGGHYVDLANDIVALPRLLALHDEAVAAGSTLVTGAGFGVLATEALVVRLGQGRDTPAAVEVDALGSVALEAGALGSAYARTTVDVLATGGRRYRDGELGRERLARTVRHLSLPDGTSASSASMPVGELIAARLATQAPSVVATSGLAPTTPVARALLPAATALMGIAAVRRFTVRRLAGIPIKAAPRPRPHSWGHAVLRWADGSRAEGWLRTGDAMDFTAAVTAAVAARLAAGDGPAGAWTPARAFGAELATDAGAAFLPAALSPASR